MRVATLAAVLPAPLSTAAAAVAGTVADPDGTGAVAAGNPDAWATLDAEVDELEAWSTALETELYQLLDKSASAWLSGATLTVGSGYSDNFYRRPNAVGAPLLHLAADFFLQHQGRAHLLEGFIFAEQQVYFPKNDRVAEGIAMAQLSYTRLNGPLHAGLRLQLFAGDQIYDANLALTGLPSTGRVRQLRPQLALFLRQPLTAGGHVTLTLAFRHTFYDDSASDFTRPALQLEWQTPSLHGLSATLRYEHFRDFYAARLPRRANGLLLTGDPITMTGHLLSADLRWQPPFLKGFSVHGSLGFQIEQADYGTYFDLERRWAQLRFQYSLGRWRFELDFGQTELDFAERQVSLFDPRPQRQTFRTVGASIQLRLRDNLTLQINGDWEDNSALVIFDNYRQRSLYGALEWAF